MGCHDSKCDNALERKHSIGMTLKRIILSILTLIVSVELGASLITSFNQPQVGNQLQLYQTDMLVQASKWEGSGLSTDEVQQFRTALFGDDPFEAVAKQYEEVRQEAAGGLARSQQQLEAASDPNLLNAELRTTIQKQQQLVDQIDLRLGLIEAQTDRVPEAIDDWDAIVQRSGSNAKVAAILEDLWKDPPAIAPDAEAVLDSRLRGWFRYSALKRLYSLQDAVVRLDKLEADERSAAEQAIVKTTLVQAVPSVAALLGGAGLIALIGQRLLKGKESVLAIPDGQWEVPWNWETVWQVIVGGFLFIGQIALPGAVLAVRSILSAPTGAIAAGSGMADGGVAAVGLITGLIAEMTSRGKALYSLGFYVAMAASTLGVLYWSIKPYLPLSKDWFRITAKGRWPLWGLGSYLVALPLMLAVAFLNQQIWQGQGGNNPLLQLVLEERDPLALGLFLFTAAVAAPVFEEILFRGFLLPSLTKYMSAWRAIALSGLIFAVAHLSFSEILPLTLLGAILGFVYVRSQNLLASILLHSTWNSATMIGLFLLGSSR